MLASEKWSSSLWRLSISFNLKHLGTSMGSSFCHVSHCICSLSGMTSSQPMLFLHSSCNILFPRGRNGAAKPSGSYIELTVDRIQCLISGLSLRVIQNLKASFSMFHSAPRTHLGRSKSWFRSSFLISFVCNSIGVDLTL